MDRRQTASDPWIPNYVTTRAKSCEVGFSETGPKPLPFGPWNSTRQKHKHDAAIGMKRPRLSKAGVRLFSGVPAGQTKNKRSEHEFKIASHISHVFRIARGNRTVALAPNGLFAPFQSIRQKKPKPITIARKFQRLNANRKFNWFHRVVTHYQVTAQRQASFPAQIAIKMTKQEVLSIPFRTGPVFDGHILDAKSCLS